MSVTVAIDSLLRSRESPARGATYEPDSLRMTVALEAVREELANRRSQVHRLECVEALLCPIHPSDTARDPTPASQRAPRVPATDSNVKNPTRAQLRAYICAHAPTSRRELLAAFGGSPRATDKKLKAMLVAGEIGVDGERGARQYRPPERRAKMPRPELVSTAALPDRGVYPVYDAIVDRDGATTEQLARQTGLPADLVVEQGRRLVQLGLVRFTRAGRARKWLPIESNKRSDAA
jgi:hypothetical protein